MKKYDKYKDSGIEWIGEIPEHWEVKKIKYVLTINDETLPETTIEDYEIEYVEISNVKSGIGILSTDLFEFKDAPSRARRIVKDGDIIVSTVRTYLKSIATIKQPNQNLIVSTGFAVLRPRTINSSYIGYQFYSDALIGEIISISVGVSYPAISPNQIGNISIPIPPPPEQTAIATYLDRKTAEIDQLIDTKKRLIELYHEEKTAIINQAVTKGINPNAKMKDSGVEWLGEIPEHWEVKRLKYVGKFINGYSFKSTEFESSGVRVLKISNIQHMRIDWSDESFIDEHYYETQKDFRVLKNDLVFALTRPIISSGIKVALMDSDEKILLNQRNSIFRPIDIDVKWVYYQILSSGFIQDFDSRIDKTGQQPNISSYDIGEISIPKPNNEEQKTIIEFIDNECSNIDTKIERTQRLIELLAEYRTALISEVVTGKVKVV